MLTMDNPPKYYHTKRYKNFGKDLNVEPSVGVGYIISNVET